MINYTLRCAKGHEFDAWFASAAEYDRQHGAGLVSCAICNDKNISKALMTPHLATKGNRKSEILSHRESPTRPGKAVPAPAQMAVEAATFMEKYRAFRNEIEQKYDNVGKAFAETAQRIHYGEEEKRGIYGTATKEEAESLHDEGIMVFPLPDLPKDH